RHGRFQVEGSDDDVPGLASAEAEPDHADRATRLRLEEVDRGLVVRGLVGDRALPERRVVRRLVGQLYGSAGPPRQVDVEPDEAGRRDAPDNVADVLGLSTVLV